MSVWIIQRFGAHTAAKCKDKVGVFGQCGTDQYSVSVIVPHMNNQIFFLMVLLFVID